MRQPFPPPPEDVSSEESWDHAVRNNRLSPALPDSARTTISDNSR